MRGHGIQFAVLRHPLARARSTCRGPVPGRHRGDAARAGNVAPAPQTA